MTREDYILNQARELKKLTSKMKKMSARYLDDNTSQKARQNLNADMNWCGMYIGQTEERLKYALGVLLPENAQETWEPSGWHSYKGIGDELSKTKFEL